MPARVIVVPGRVIVVGTVTVYCSTTASDSGAGLGDRSRSGDGAVYGLACQLSDNSSYMIYDSMMPYNNLVLIGVNIRSSRQR